MSVSATEPAPWQPIIADLHIAASTLFLFRHDGGGDLAEETDEMIWITLDTLVRVPGDAVLSFQQEPIWLLRRDGQVSQHTEPEFWTPARLQMVQMLYVQTAMYFPA